MGKLSSKTELKLCKMALIYNLSIWRAEARTLYILGQPEPERENQKDQGEHLQKMSRVYNIVK